MMAAASIFGWPLVKQLSGLGEAPLSEAGLGPEAISERTRALRGRIAAPSVDVVPTICPYCAVGCGQLVYVKRGGVGQPDRILSIEGDPLSPINQGTLCPKGAAAYQLHVNPSRWTTVKYRAPYAERWEDRPLAWAMERIADLVKQTRDASYVERTADGRVVNRCMGIASLGGATLDNEENYLVKKLFAGGLGMVWIENQARV
jgi:formate dehydrogenase major subunit